MPGPTVRLSGTRPTLLPHARAAAFSRRMASWPHASGGAAARQLQPRDWPAPRKKLGAQPVCRFPRSLPEEAPPRRHRRGRRRCLRAVLVSRQATPSCRLRCGCRPQPRRRCPRPPSMAMVALTMAERRRPCCRARRPSAACCPCRRSRAGTETFTSCLGRGTAAARPAAPLASTAAAARFARWRRLLEQGARLRRSRLTTLGRTPSLVRCLPH